MRRRNQILGLVIVGWLIIAGLFVAKLGGGGQDDFFITYRYARSVAQGEGLAFNPGERHFGATEPGFALLLGGVHRLTRLPIPWLGTLGTALGLLAIALVMAADGLKHDHLTAALLGGTLVVGSTSIWVCHGAAAPLVLASLLLAAWLIDKRPEIAGVLAGAAVWLRPDAALGVLILGLLVWYEKRRLPLRFGLAAATVIAAGAAAAWIYFGSPLPSTLAAKRAMAIWRPDIWPSGLAFWKGFLPIWRTHLGFFALPILIGGIIGWICLWKQGGTAAKLLALNGAGLALAYPLLGVPFYPWYPIPVIVACLFGFAFLLIWTVRWLASGSDRSWLASPRPETIVAIALLATLTIRTAPLVLGYQGSPHLDAYRDAALWIHEHSSPESSIAYFEVGVIGWYSERPLHDLLGLVTPGVTDTLGRGGTFQNFLRRNPTDIVLDHTVRGIGGLPRQRWFQQSYEKLATFPDRGGGQVVVYRRRPPR